MKVLCICGGRDHYFDNAIYPVLKKFCNLHGITKIIQGGATGIDTCALEFANKFGYEFETYLPKWHEFGKGAGHIRNGLMAEALDILLAFPGGAGTKNMIMQAKKKRKDVYVFADGFIEIDK